MDPQPSKISFKLSSSDSSAASSGFPSSFSTAKQQQPQARKAVVSSAPDSLPTSFGSTKQHAPAQHQQTASQVGAAIAAAASYGRGSAPPQAQQQMPSIIQSSPASHAVASPAALAAPGKAKFLPDEDEIAGGDQSGEQQKPMATYSASSQPSYSYQFLSPMAASQSIQMSAMEKKMQRQKEEEERRAKKQEEKQKQAAIQKVSSLIGSYGSDSEDEDDKEAEVQEAVKQKEEEVIAGPPEPQMDRAAVHITEGDEQEDDEEEFVGPARPSMRAEEEEDDDGEDSEGEQEGDDGYEVSVGGSASSSSSFSKKVEVQQPLFPVSHEAVLKSHERLVSALALDPSGARVLTGSFDYSVRLWDFGGMDRNMKPFRVLDEPCGGYAINHLCYNLNGDHFLIVPDSARPMIKDRDGFAVCEFVKGDQYLADMSNTKGHVASVTYGQYHPGNKETIMTASMDSTVRIWDIETCETRHKTVIKAKNSRGTKVPIHTAAYSHDGSSIAAGCEDGSLQLWRMSSSFVKPDIHIKNAHMDGCTISSVKFSRDGYTLLSRAGDDTLKVWDIRNPSAGPLKTFTNLPNIFAQTDVIFSPDENFIVTAASAPQKGGSGLIAFFDRHRLELVQQIGVADSSAVRLVWHPKINQIAASTSGGDVHVYYDPDMSIKGAKLAVAKAPRKKDISDLIQPLEYGVTFETKRERIQKAVAANNKRARNPDPPNYGVGKGGKTGTSMKGFLMKSLMGDQKLASWQDDDPRAAILKHAEAAAKNPMFTSAYQKNQPQTILDYSEQREDVYIPAPKRKKQGFDA